MKYFSKYKVLKKHHRFVSEVHKIFKWTQNPVSKESESENSQNPKMYFFSSFTKNALKNVLLITRGAYVIFFNTNRGYLDH